MPRKKPSARKPKRACDERRERFVAEYLIDSNATSAAARAGYKGSRKVLGITGMRLLANAEIGAKIAAAQDRHRAKLDLTAERIHRQAAILAFGDARELYHADGRLKLPHEMTAEQFALVQSMDHEELWEWQPIGGAPPEAPDGKRAKKKGGGERTERVQVGVVRKVRRHDALAALHLASDLLGLRNQAGSPAPAGGLVIQIQASDGKPIR